MKNIFLIYALLAFSSLIGQTLTQKYNSYLNRYEFFNNSGTLIGYKEYNKFLNQWEYFSSEETTKSSYIDPIDHEDMERTMSKLQNNYDNNSRIVNQRLNEVLDIVDQLRLQDGFSSSKYYKPVINILQNLKSLIDNNRNIDFSKKSTGQYYLNLIQPYYNEIKYYKANFDAERTQILSINSEPKREEDDIFYYNMGVEKQSENNILLAKSFYKKALEINPSHVGANINMAVLILKREAPIIKEMNSLGSTEKDNKRYEILKSERIEVYKDALPYLESAKKGDPKNEEVKKTLKSIYIQLQNSNTKSSTSNTDSNVNPIPDRLFGGYETQIIEEYEWNFKTKKFNLLREINLPSKLYFDMKIYAFKRGSNSWLFNKWSYSGYDTTNKSYIYFDDRGSTLVIDENFESVAWFFDRDKEGNFKKIIRYKTLKPNKTVNPE